MCARGALIAWIRITFANIERFWWHDQLVITGVALLVLFIDHLTMTKFSSVVYLLIVLLAIVYLASVVSQPQLHKVDDRFTPKTRPTAVRTASTHSSGPQPIRLPPGSVMNGARQPLRGNSPPPMKAAPHEKSERPSIQTHTVTISTASFPFQKLVFECQNFTPSALHIPTIEAALKIEHLYNVPSSLTRIANCFQAVVNPVNDFCTFVCPFFQREQDTLHDYQKLIAAMEAIPPSKDWQKEDFPIAVLRSYEAANTTYWYTNIPNDLPNMHFFEIDQQTNLLALLPTIARDHPVVLIDFGNDLICQRAVAELFYFAHRHVLFGFNAWQSFVRQPKKGSPGFLHPISFSDMETKYLSSTMGVRALDRDIVKKVRGRSRSLQHLADYAHAFATSHLQMEVRCRNLLHAVHLGDRIYAPVPLSYPMAPQQQPPSTTTTAETPSSKAASSFIAVISHYKEDYKPLQFFQSVPHVIVNRGDAHDKVSGLHLVYDSHNVGRENAVYLNYIIEHYAALPRVIVFTQSDARSNFDHSFTQEAYERDIRDLCAYAQDEGAMATIFGSRDHRHQRSLLAGNANVTQQPSAANTAGVSTMDRDGFFFLGHLAMHVSTGVTDVDKVDTLLPKFFREVNARGDESPSASTETSASPFVLNRWFGPGASMVVTAEVIRRRSRASYQRLLKLLLEDPATLNNPPMGHFYERFWPAIFNSRCAEHSYYACFYHRGANLWTDRFRDPPLLTFA